MEQQDYYEDGPARIKRLMQETFQDDFVLYILGERELTQYELPACMIAEKPGTVVAGPTGFDIITEVIQITLALNADDDIGAQPDALLTERKLQQIVKAQDKTTGTYLDKTVVGALRRNFTLYQGVIDSNIDISFDYNARGERVDGQALLTTEAYVTVTVQRQVPVTRVPS